MLIRKHAEDRQFTPQPPQIGLAFVRSTNSCQPARPSLPTSGETHRAFDYSAAQNSAELAQDLTCHARNIDSSHHLAFAPKAPLQGQRFY